MSDRLPPADLPSADPSSDARTLELRSFGRRRGRTFGPRGAHLLRETLPTVALDLARPAVTQLEPGRPLWLEIGFGGAEHLLWQARANPEVTLIGCEPFRDGVIKALTGIVSGNADGTPLGGPLGNVRLHDDDARPVLRWLPPASVARAFVLFPDPWPKRKHVKRRLVAPSTLALLARVMAPGAELRIATDIGDYARTILIAIQGEPAFHWPARGPDDWRVRPADWPPTRYEQKALREGRRCAYFRFVRTSAGQDSGAPT